MKKIIFFIICNFFILSVNADKVNLNSKSAILIEASTKEVLYKDNENAKLPIASLTKIASMLLIMEQIDLGNLKLNDKVNISENAESMGGSQVYIKAGETYTVKELLKTVALASANDSIVALAEKTYGTEENFVEKMNEKVKKLGLKNTHFVNVHGLDADNHYSSAYDMAILASELLKYDDILEYTSKYEDYFKRNDGSEIWLVNTNKLVKFYDGVDGLKTGYTTEAGYCVTATAKKDNMRLISVVIGEKSIENRSLDTIKLLNYGFSNYNALLIKDKNTAIGKIEILNGKVDSTDLYLKNDAIIIKNINSEKDSYTYKINIDKLYAPVKKNTKVGTVKILNSKNKLVKEIDIVVKSNIKKANLIDLFIKNMYRISCFSK